ncbi:hypothetical protein [Alienimonas chondri]|uniref:HEAT repeat domain-containing protein n=1 Tax=Alienimonas chondri TaxID=2681879 RepID=A0ABX1VGJ6_9PLAN|nr:hypothetical protein [Alienimonas chondri]NNJ26571.1 hypothetical protein [Alienimonas chondri]
MRTIRLFPSLKVVPPRRTGATLASGIAWAAALSLTGLSLTGCDGGTATVANDPNAAPGRAPTTVAANPAPVATPDAAPADTGTARPSTRPTTRPDRTPSDRTGTGAGRPDARPTESVGMVAQPLVGRADAAEVAARKAVRDRRAALGFSPSPGSDEDRTATVQLLGVDGPLPGLAAAARDALAAAFPSDVDPLLLEGETADAPPVLYLADAPDLDQAAGAAAFLSPAEPVAGDVAEDFALSRTTAVRIDAAALLDQWLTDADAPDSAATVALRIAPSAPEVADAPTRGEENPFSATASSQGPGSGFGSASPPTAEQSAEAVRRALFALGPDGDPDTADTRTPGWTVIAVPHTAERPAAHESKAESPPDRRRGRGSAAEEEPADGGTAREGTAAYLLIAGPLEAPSKWLESIRPSLSDGANGVTLDPSTEGASMPTVLSASAELDAAPRTLPAPAEGDEAGWGFDLAARRDAGDEAADASPNPGESPRDWALRVLPEGSREAQTLAARYLSAVAPAPGADPPEGAEEVRTALLAALSKDSAGGPPPPGREDDNPFNNGDDNPFGNGEEASNPFDAGDGGGGGPFSATAGAGGGERAVFVALLRWCFTPEHYAEAGEAAGRFNEATLSAILDRTADDPAAAEAIIPLSKQPGTGARILAAIKEPNAPAEPVAIALLSSREMEVRTSATELLSEIGGLDAAAALADAARTELDRVLAKEMRKARIPILERARD